jgi:hypothetical protein
VLASQVGTTLEVFLGTLVPLALPLSLLLDVPLFCAVVALGAGIESLVDTTKVLYSRNEPCTLGCGKCASS